LLLEGAPDLLGFGLPLLELAAELADVVLTETDRAAVAAGLPGAGLRGAARRAGLWGRLSALLALSLLLALAILASLVTAGLALLLALPTLVQPSAFALAPPRLGTLPRALAQPVVERLEPADQLARAVERLGEPVLGRPADRRGRLRDVLPDPVDVRADLFLQHPRVLAGPLLNDAAGPEDLVHELGVADCVGGLLEVAGRFLLLGAGGSGEAVEPALEVGDGGGERFLALLEPPHLFTAAVGRVEPCDVARDALLLIAQALGLGQCVLDLPLDAGLATLLQQPARLLQPVEGGLAGAGVVAGGGTPHLLHGLAQAAGALHQLGRALLAGETLELTSDGVGLLCELALVGAAALAALHVLLETALPLDLLLLPACELAQALGDLIELLALPLGLAALHGLVLVPHAVQLELEQVGEVIGVGGRAGTARLAHGDLHLTERGLRALEVLERALFGGQRLVGPAGAELLLGDLHLLRGLRQRLRDGLHQ